MSTSAWGISEHAIPTIDEGIALTVDALSMWASTTTDISKFCYYYFVDLNSFPSFLHSNCAIYLPCIPPVGRPPPGCTHCPII